MPLPVPPAKVSVANVQAPPTAFITPPALPAHVVVDAVAAPHAAGRCVSGHRDVLSSFAPATPRPPLDGAGGKPLKSHAELQTRASSSGACVLDRRQGCRSGFARDGAAVRDSSAAILVQRS